MTRVRVGSRGSMLALAQSNWVKQQLMQRYADLQVDLTVIKTSGDQFVDRPIAAIGGKGVFTKEIEDALLRGDIDIAVHSMKDLPTELPAGLTIAAVPLREDARDVLVSQSREGLKALPRGARLATGSLRRQAQLLHYRADLSLAPIRGNIDTRLRKLAAGEADALVMAAAGLKRIGRAESITEFLPDEVCVSAVAQGALGIEARDDGAMAALLAFLHDAGTSAEVAAERALLGRLGGGCHVPIGARARVAGDQLTMLAVVAQPNGKSLCRGEISGQLRDAIGLGRGLAEQLIHDGADKILASS
ncbi:MAG TPA: hydroxymethylbilane synthase [Candidatus Limnocylindrales bacterium]|nr:hydroxymethylbilane synthase [Candidatus Limnocylindrales bacterium]